MLQGDGEVILGDIIESLDESERGALDRISARELLNRYFPGSLRVDSDDGRISLNEGYEVGDFAEDIQILVNATRQKESVRLRLKGKERG